MMSSLRRIWCDIGRERDRGEREIYCEDELERDFAAASPRRLNAGRQRGQRVVGRVIETVNVGNEQGRSIGEDSHL